MYSKIPMPQSEWTDENMSLAMCFFPWVGAVIGLASWVVYQAGGWLADRQETLSSGIPSRTDSTNGRTYPRPLEWYFFHRLVRSV